MSVDHDQVVAYIPNLRRYARALVGDGEAADDLVQDTLERAVRKFALWRPGNLRAWLFSIMHNVFVNQVKARKVRFDEELDENLPAHMPTVNGDDVADLQRALLQLTPGQREVVLLIALEDMTYNDVSKMLGIPVGTVMSRLSRGRERLRQLLDGEPARAPLKVVR